MGSIEELNPSRDDFIAKAKPATNLIGVDGIKIGYLRLETLKARLRAVKSTSYYFRSFEFCVSLF